jgi:hypothetical protein
VVKEIDSSECPAIAQLIESSKTQDDGKPVDEHSHLKWFHYSKFIEVEAIEDSTKQKVYYAKSNLIKNAEGNEVTVMLLLLGTQETCTKEFIHELSRVYSIPAYKYKNPPNVLQFRRHSVWVEKRNKLIKGFTKDNDNYYLVADGRFHQFYSLYGFCSVCGILRCSPVWCICGHKELSDKWTSNNKKLDEFIRKSQRQTKSANEAYLEWISFDRIEYLRRKGTWINDLPTNVYIELIPLEITDETKDSYYDKVNSIQLH